MKLNIDIFVIKTIITILHCLFKNALSDSIYYNTTVIIETVLSRCWIKQLPVYCFSVSFSL